MRITQEEYIEFQVYKEAYLKLTGWLIENYPAVLLKMWEQKAAPHETDSD